LELEDKITLIMLVGLALLVVGLPTACTMHQNKLIAESPDPVATACAINSTTSACLPLVARDPL
jgi:hypothetical protein